MSASAARGRTRERVPKRRPPRESRDGAPRRRRSASDGLRGYLAGLDRPRKVAATAGVLLAIAGGVMVAVSPPPPMSVPVVGEPAEDAPLLQYVRSLPDAGDPPLVRPVGLAAGAGQLFVADSGAAVVRIFSTAGPSIGEIGRGALAAPAYVARDVAAGTVLVTDRELGAVLRFGEDGEPLGEIVPSTETTGTWTPLGIAADGEGTLAVTDSTDQHRVLIMDRAGRVSRTLGGPVTAEGPGGVSVSLDYPNAVGFRDDELWVADSNNRRVLVFDTEGALQRLIRVDGIARGLAFIEGEGPDERFVAVVDAMTSEIVLLDAAGDELTRYGGPGSTAGKLAFPNDVVFDSVTGQVFVADTGNARVQVWSVTWPAEQESPIIALPQPVLSAMRAAGIIVLVLGMLLLVVALWPRRQAARELLHVDDEADGYWAELGGQAAEESDR